MERAGTVYLENRAPSDGAGATGMPFCDGSQP